MNLKSLVSSTAFCTFILIITIFNVAKASEQVLATISRDEGSLIYKLVVNDNDGMEIKTFYNDVYERGIRIRRTELDPIQLYNQGMILEQRDKHIVLKLTSTNFDLEQGGIIIADTLYNGASGERRSYEIQLAKSKTGWGLFKKGKSIKEISIQTNKIIIIGAVGIKNLVMK
jgi:hypothetical protein